MFLAADNAAFDFFPKLLGFFVIPGIFPMYVTSQVGWSPFLCCSSGCLGMLALYGSLGLTLDFFLFLVRGGRKAHDKKTHQ